MRKKIITWLLLCSVCIVSVPIPEEAKDRTAKDITAKEISETSKVVEAPDLDAFLEAAVTTAKEDATDEEAFENPWTNKRLLVKSDGEFDPMGAGQVICGYGNLFVLEYISEKATKAAYQVLQKTPGIVVEADASYAASSEMTQKSPREEILPGQMTDAKNPPGKRDVLVAVLDTGWDEKSYGSKRLTEGTDLTGADTVMDENGHGTAMTNIILTHTPDCVKVMPVKVADEKGHTSVLKLYAGICYAAENGADIINISMSAYQAAGSKILRLAICEASKAGIPVVVSAGNAGCDSAGFSPANVEEAIVVSAADHDKKTAEYSNYGAYVDYCSFGTMKTSGLRGESISQTGTSVAAALVSAAAAGKKAYYDIHTYDELIRLLDGAAKDLGEPGRDDLYGRGFLLPELLQDDKKEEQEEKGKLPLLLSCGWKDIPVEELDDYIGKASNLERRIFLDKLDAGEKDLLLSKDTLFSREVIYSENSFDKEGNTKETFRMEGRLYDIVMSEASSDIYEIQAQKYHIFTYGSEKGARSCIRLDTEANKNDAVIYCWMKDRSSENQNSGKYGITFVPGKSAYDFKQCTHKIENCDATDTGNPVVWRLKIRKVKIEKPENMAINYDASLWDKSTFKIVGNTVSGFKKHYWYIYNYQVKPASDSDRQKAYGDGSYHGGFWDLKDASGKKCGETLVTTSVDIGTRDLYADERKAGITYRLPLTAHKNKSTQKNVTDAVSTCTKKGSYHTETTYTCDTCDKKWTVKGKPVETAQLAHVFAEKKDEDHGILNGRCWEECVRSCGGTDVNGEYWQRNFKYLHPIRYWEMHTDGSYGLLPEGMERSTDYHAAAAWLPLWSRTPSEEFLTGTLEAFAAPAQASYYDIYIPRKQYKVQYDGNGATGGMMESQDIYCGEVFDLRKNGFKRTGYEFAGFSLKKEGKPLYGKGLKNLSLIHEKTVTLYAQWDPKTVRITLDSQGAKNEGTTEVYEQYAKGYYTDFRAAEPFKDNKIEIPQKELEDKSLQEGKRRQRFLGYYTKKKNGYKMIDDDGSLVADINYAGDYRYFSKDATVYAGWEDMYAVQFHPNLTEKDMELLGTDENGKMLDAPVVCPFTRWKEKGKTITIGYGEAVIQNEKWKPFYRFLGWSLTPEISGADEIILTKDLCAHTFAKDEDVTLYAQWDTAFVTAYMGNEGSQGEDFLSVTKRLTNEHVFAGNSFLKTAQKPTEDILAGRTENEKGEPCMETVSYRFLGWSLKKECSGEEGVIFGEKEKMAGNELILAAAELSEQEGAEALTFGKPASGYRNYSVSEEMPESEVPFINLYAVWDQYPQIKAADLYLPLADARAGILTEDYLLSLALATDEELKSEKNRNGVMKKGEDADNLTSFTIADYQAADFTEAEADMNLTVTYKARDRAGNVTKKMVRIYLADLSGQKEDAGSVRFISQRHKDTLDKNSVWRTGEYAKKLARALENKKTKEEYSTVTPLQKAFGVSPVKKPGSGDWNHVQEVWEFSHEEVLAIQAYAADAGIGGDPSDFLEKFGRCRVR